MIVTINSDASFSKLYQRGSYAFWIVSNHGRLWGSGLLKEECSRAEIAEFQCIINAVHRLIKSKWGNIDKIIINTDCLNVAHLIKRNKIMTRRYRLFEWGMKYLDIFENMVKESYLEGVEIEVRHVKAHVSTSTPRQYVNDWCDRKAKEHIHEYLKTQLIEKDEDI